MEFRFDLEPSDMRLMVEFLGGPYDGSVTADRIIQCVETDDDIESALAIATFAGTEGRVGETVVLPSIEEAERRVVRPHGMSAISGCQYRITDRLDGEAEILLRAEHVN